MIQASSPVEPPQNVRAEVAPALDRNTRDGQSGNGDAEEKIHDVC
jgi:hypothetical protein